MEKALSEGEGGGPPAAERVEADACLSPPADDDAADTMETAEATELALWFDNERLNGIGATTLTTFKALAVTGAVKRRALSAARSAAAAAAAFFFFSLPFSEAVRPPPLPLPPFLVGEGKSPPSTF
jgi:hypothetical protein